MPSATFILGGARSGKSRRALFLAEQAGTNRLFIATAQAFDEEMAARIERHRAERAAGWTTIEAPLELSETLQTIDGRCDVCLVDCLTLWLSNLMHHQKDLEQESQRLCQAICTATVPIILVSNEVGLGLVPQTPLGREFRDAQGRLNQAIAAQCDRVEFIAAGLPLTLKG